MNLEFHLQMAGALQLGLALLHVALPRRFDWNNDLAKLSLINRQIFIVHCLFIVLVLVLFGGLSVFCSELLLARHALAAVVLGGLLLFWAARLYAQWFIYSSQLWRGHRFHTVMHWFFTAMWAYYVAVYGTAFWQQMT